jgi:RNA polymerase sigma factor (sigma-70 family)
VPIVVARRPDDHVAEPVAVDVARARFAPRPEPGDGSSSPPLFDGLPGDTTGVVSQVFLLEVRDKIRRCLEELTPAKRDVLVLRIMEQRTNQEIAEILGLEPNTVAVRYKRALEDLRTLLPTGVFDDLWEATR